MVLFYIDLDHNPSGRVPYFPGQRVSGRVTLENSPRKRIRGVQIILAGIYMTKVLRHTGVNGALEDHGQTVVVCNFKQWLKAPENAQSTSFSLPFRFSLPDSLPPSFDLGHRVYSRATISYHLLAEINPDFRFNRQKQRMLELTVRLSANQPLPLPSAQPICLGNPHYRSHRLRPQRHSTKQKLAHIFTNDPTLKTPSLDFKATAYIPSAASVSQHLPLAISILYQQNLPTDPSNPLLKLEKAILKLNRYTRFEGSHPYADVRKQTVARKDILIRTTLALDDTRLEISDRIRLVDMDSALHPLVPSFSCHGISCFYILSVTFFVSHPGRRMTPKLFKLKTKERFTILPSERLNAVSGPSRNARGVAMTNKDPVDLDGIGGQEELPAYHQVHGDPSPSYR